MLQIRIILCFVRIFRLRFVSLLLHYLVYRLILYPSETLTRHNANTQFEIDHLDLDHRQNCTNDGDPQERRTRSALDRTRAAAAAVVVCKEDVRRGCAPGHNHQRAERQAPRIVRHSTANAHARVTIAAAHTVITCIVRFAYALMQRQQDVCERHHLVPRLGRPRLPVRVQASRRSGTASPFLLCTSLGSLVLCI